MIKANSLLAVVFCLFVAGAVVAAQDAMKPDPEGFIRNWLILAPIPYEGEDNGAAEIVQEQIKGEGGIQPKAGGKTSIAQKEYTWKEVKLDDYFIDFAKLAPGRTEDVIGYAVTYVRADEEMKDVKLKIGSNDQSRVYLNGKAVITFDDTRTLEKDQNDAVVILNKGLNTVVFKVINQKNNWQACLRFTDKSDKPITNLKITSTP